MRALHGERYVAGSGLVVKLSLFWLSVCILIVRTGLSGMLFKKDKDWVDFAIRLCRSNLVMLIDTLDTLPVRA